MAMLPDWVKKYKEKGTTIRKIGNQYYKYKIHSERRPGKKYPVLVQDELIAIINEEGYKESVNKVINPFETEHKTLYEFKDNGIYIEEFNKDEINELNKIVLIKIKNHWYFLALTEKQKEILEKHKVGNKNGIFI